MSYPTVLLRVTWFDCLVGGHRMAPFISQLVNHLPAMQETGVQFPGSEDPLEKGMATHLVFLPGEPHGQRSLEGYSPWGHKSQTRLSY